MDGHPYSSTHQCPPSDTGLHTHQGGFWCVAYTGDNPLAQHGPLRLSEDRRTLTYADGEPFFWLADTAWNGVLRSKAEDWDRYLQAPSEQAFTAIQFVSTQCDRAEHAPRLQSSLASRERKRHV